MENPIKMDDLGVPLYLETPIYQTWILYKPSYGPHFGPETFDGFFRIPRKNSSFVVEGLYTFLQYVSK